MLRSLVGRRTNQRRFARPIGAFHFAFLQTVVLGQCLIQSSCAREQKHAYSHTKYMYIPYQQPTSVQESDIHSLGCALGDGMHEQPAFMQGLSSVSACSAGGRRLIGHAHFMQCHAERQIGIRWPNRYCVLFWTRKME